LQCRSSLVWSSPICSLFLLDAEPFGFCLGSHSLHLFIPTASWSCFRVSGIISRSLIHFELILVQGERQGSSFSLLRVDIQFSQQLLFKRLSFIHCVLGSFVKDLLAIDEWAYIRLFDSDPLVFLSVFVPKPCFLLL
jgi:hypothetical protein